MMTTTEIFMIVNNKRLEIYDEVETSFCNNMIYSVLFGNLQKNYPAFKNDIDDGDFKSLMTSPDISNEDILVLVSFIEEVYIERNMIMDLVYAFRTSKLVSPNYNELADLLEELHNSSLEYNGVILNQLIDGYGSFEDLSEKEQREIIKSYIPISEFYNKLKKV